MSRTDGSPDPRCQPFADVSSMTARLEQLAAESLLCLSCDRWRARRCSRCPLAHDARHVSFSVFTRRPPRRQGRRQPNICFSASPLRD